MKVVVIGSGPSGLHFAATALQRGQAVMLVDIGNSGPAVPAPQSRYADLKRDLPDPVGYFLGKDFEGIEVPLDDGESEYYRLPPSKNHVFARPDSFVMATDGITPLASFGQGGLAECWTAGAYPFNDHDLAAFPFGYDELAPYYATVAERIGVGGRGDDLAPYFPVHAHLRAPVALNESSARLLAAYDAQRASLHARHKARLGRSRQAALSSDMDGRGGCFQCGRCLWGCPNGALYTPSITLRALRQDPRFTYLGGRYASHFLLSGHDTIRALHVHPAGGGAAEEIGGDVFVLACGAIGSSALFLRTHWFARREILVLDGLMDNRQVLAPFFNIAMLGRQGDPASYQYHQLAVGLETVEPAHYVHGQITMFTTGAAHPVIQQLPLGLQQARKVFRELRSGLGVLNLNFHDDRRAGNHITLNPAAPDASGGPALSLRYRPRPDEDRAIRDALRPLRKFFRDLGAPIIPGMTKLRPMGASVHYAGTLPMSAERKPLTVSPTGQSHDLANLYVADGAAFPFLPAKNLTFSLMALATRVAARLF